MNHKRHRSKHRRAGCLLCKPHKANGCKHREKHSVKKRQAAVEEQIRELLNGAQAGAEELDRSLRDIFDLPRNGLVLRNT